MKFSRDMVFPGRVLAEDDDFITMEIAKHDDVSFSLQRDENNEVVGGDRFLTLLFIHAVRGVPKVWKPWEHGGEE
jgi:hypothetical protein